MKYVLVALGILWGMNPNPLYAQEIKNVRFHQQDTLIVVEYDLSGEHDHSYKVSLLYSWNGGRTFRGPATMTSGEVGVVAPGRGKKMVWAPLGEIGPIVSQQFMLRVQAEYVALPSEMVLIPGGTFTMGSPPDEEGRYSDEVQHQVYVDDFHLSKYEVTFAQYDAFCKATGHKKPDDEGWGRDQRPVINVSWYDAIEYCNWRSKQEKLQVVYQIDKARQDPNNQSSTDPQKWLVTPTWQANGYRLPTEAEWEYAARGGGKQVLFGNGTNILDPAEANFEGSESYKMQTYKIGTFRRETIPVGSLNTPNELGLYDMSGNVYEWCWDWYDTYPRQLADNPKGASSGARRVARGGSWSSRPSRCRVAYRYSFHAPAYRRTNLGFRLSRSSRP